MKTIAGAVRRIISVAQPEQFRNWRKQRGEIAYYKKKAADAGMHLTDTGKKLCLHKNGKAILIARNNYPYLFDLIGNFDYYFDAVRPTVVNDILTQDFSCPSIQVQQEDGLEFCFPSLPEPMETTRIYMDEGHIAPGETVFDLGAYAGGASYFFSRAVGTEGRVFAFEPDPESYPCLKANIERHGLNNVSAFQLGIWSSSGNVLFQSEGNMGSAIRDAADRFNPNVVKIQTISLSDFCEQHNVPQVDFVKIDIEGSEVAVLESAGEFIDTFCPRFAIEIHRLGAGLTDERVIAALRRHGYSVRLVPQAGLPLPLLFAEPAGS